MNAELKFVDLMILFTFICLLNSLIRLSYFESLDH
jgi:hypothetical protein